MRGRKSEKTALMRALLEQGYKPKDIVTEVIKIFPELKVNVARVQISLIKKQNKKREMLITTSNDTNSTVPLQSVTNKSEIPPLTME